MMGLFLLDIHILNYKEVGRESNLRVLNHIFIMLKYAYEL
jgi:hypothetical protein